MYKAGAGFPTLKVSPLAAPARPNAALKPLPPAISGLKKNDAFFHNFLPKYKVEVTDMALSEALCKLFGPEYLALKSGCPCQIEVN